MTVGISTAHANATLDTMKTSYAKLKLHTGDPGAAGSANASSVTTTRAITWASAASGSVSANGTLPSWTSWAGTSPEDVTHVSFLTSGDVFVRSAALSGGTATMQTGYTLNITAITVTLSPLAA